jgi:hypothetical protein
MIRLLSRPLKGCLGVILGVACAASLQAATFTTTFRQGVGGYTGTLDTDLNANEPDRVQGNDDQNLADLDNPIAQALLRFENIFGTGPGQVPPGATISSATLTLRTSNLGDLCRGFRVLVPWNETTSTWNSMTNGISADDVEMASTVLFELDAAAVGDIFNLDVTATVQDWFAGVYPNLGWGITNAGNDGWQFNSSEFSTVDFRPMLSITFDSPCVPITIVTQPASTNVNEGNGVTFSVVAGGTGVTYQWLRDGVPIQDATNANYTIPRVFRADAGNYSVVLNNECSGPITSVNAALTVTADNTAPVISAAYGTNDNVTLFVVFSEIVTNAADPLNYTVFLTSDPGTQLLVASATYGDPTAAEGRVVVLTLDPTTPWIGGQSYSISGTAASDLFGNPIDPSGVTPISLYSDTFFTISADKNWSFLDPRANPPAGWNTLGFNDSTWASGPALLGVEETAIAEPIRTPLVLGGITYYFRTHFDYDGPAGNGVLRFRTMLDDSAIIYLNGAEIQRIRMPGGAVEYTTQGAGDAVGNASYEGPYTVAVTNLVVGDNVIAVELHQIGTGSSDVVWGMEFGAVTASIDPITIITQPVGTNVIEPAPFTLRVEASGSSPQYQWYLNDVPIEGATSRTYTVNPSNCDIHGGQYHVVVFNDAPSSVTSSKVTVGVTCDTTLPAVACVYGTNDVLVVVFSENVTMDWSTAAFNFIIHPEGGGAALGLSSVTNTSGTNFGTTILATIDPSSPRDPNVSYAVDISGVEDLASPPNFINPVTISIPFFASAPRLALTAQWRYNTSGTDLGTAWQATAYNDSTWPLGNAPFDAKRPQRTNVGGILIGTQTTLSNAANTAQIPTHYFRTHFNYSGPSSATLQFNAFIDDGAVYYLNGEEILRVGMPAAPAPISYSTLATRTTGDASNELVYACVDNLVSGDNVLAVELHQSDLGSSDLTFATEVSVYTATPPAPEARLTITRGTGTQSNQINVSWTGSGILQESSNLSTHPNGWSNVSGVVGNSYNTSIGTGNRFFRIAPSP